jgi:hypothetical protein
MTQVLNNHERQRYEAVDHGTVLGYAVYRDLGDAVELPHTVVEPAHEGQGVASAVVRFALDDIRASGRRVLPTCAFVAA